MATNDSIGPSDNGASAFPVAGMIGDNQTGMTLRDYFAAKAMQGLIDGYDYEIREKDKGAGRTQRTGFDDHPHADSDSTFASQMAEESYVIADAMLRERGRL